MIKCQELRKQNYFGQLYGSKSSRKYTEGQAPRKLSADITSTICSVLALSYLKNLIDESTVSNVVKKREVFYFTDLCNYYHTATSASNAGTQCNRAI